jgi:hypothetical protein
VIVTAQDVDELALRIAIDRTRHSDPDSFDGRRQTRAAFRRWRERLPATLSLDADVPILVARHRAHWLGSAAGLVRSLDPSGLGSGSFHAIDAGGFGFQSTNTLGFTLPGLFDLARPLLPVSARRGPVVALNLRELVSDTLTADDDQDEPTICVRVGFSVAAVALHEAAHVVASREPEPRLETDLPPELVFPVIAKAAATPDKPTRRLDSHGLDWLRSFAHLSARAVARPPAKWWLDVFAADVAAVYPGPGEDWLDALSPELAITDRDEPIADVLDRPPPPGFVRLHSQRSAA